MSLTSSDRVRAYRTRQRELGAPDITRRYRKEDRRAYKQSHRFEDRTFVGCDGEGCGVDEIGRQLYMLFRMGERELFTGSRLQTAEILDFICDSPSGEILVGFAFGYDTTMILRDLPVAQQKRLFEPKLFTKGHSPYVWFKNFNIDYLPKQYLKIQRVRIERLSDGSERRIVIPGSTRTIFETFGFFQKSFVKVIREFEVGLRSDRDRVELNKARRSSFETIGQEEREYCGLEVEMLAELMSKLREYCNAAGIRPRTWNGAGKLAAALHSLHDTPKAADLVHHLPRGLGDFANMAYYGGRFEITRTGSIKETVYEYDIRSAYPDAMRHLPCLTHGRWEEASGKALQKFAADNPDGLFVAACTFKAARRGDGIGQLGSLPVRSREGHLYWPLQGGGVYWSCELASARKLGYSCRYKAGWVFHRACDCEQFGWVERLYEYRRSIGSAGPGYPIKLGINSLYGKLAQRKGNGAYNNMIWAGLITARTRAKLNHAIASNPGRIVMVATDAVYSLDPLPDLACGDRLGDWEQTVLAGLFIVQPGLYWCPAKRKKKSRGLSGKFFEEPGLTESFERAWETFRANENSGNLVDFPEVSVPVPGFIGLKLAVARNKPETAGRWVHDQRVISFDYRNKRQGHAWVGESIVTRIKQGYPGLLSLPHREFLAAGGQEPWEAARAMLEEQPDYVDFEIPFKD